MAKLWLFSVVFTLGQVFAQPQIGGGNCSTASLTGDYAATFTGRQVSSSGAFTGVFQSIGQVNFDGQGTFTATYVVNTNSAAGAIGQGQRHG